jgi:amidohydrolase
LCIYHETSITPAPVDTINSRIYPFVGVLLRKIKAFLKEEDVQRRKKTVTAQVDAMAGELDQISRLLYENPETAYKEYQSCSLLCEFLENHGFKVQSPAGGLETAFYAEPENAATIGPEIAFLAEYDALEKIGHGCGHNMIAAMSLGAATALLNALPEFSGSIRVIGTPAEEGGGGKAKLADAGIFEGIDIAIMTHPGHENLVGENTLGRIKAKTEFFGRTAHAAAAPEMGLNALDAMVGAYNNISALRQQTTEDSRVHGIITHGGDAPNVIPDYASGLFYIRAGTREVLDRLFTRFQDCCNGAALAAGCRCEVRVELPSLDPIKRNRALEALWAEEAAFLGLEITRKDKPSGSTDLGNLSWIIPVIQPFIAICDKSVALHSTGFADATRTGKGRKAVLDGAKALALCALDYLSSPEIQKAVREEFKTAWRPAQV